MKDTTARAWVAHPQDPNVPTLAELQAEEASDRSPLDGMTPCPWACGAHFHGESVAYWQHVNDRDRTGDVCPDPWAAP